MKTIQQKLADRIYELLPEKLELTFGCETSEGIFLKQNKDKGYFFTEENLNIVSKNEFKLLGIKGQPIRLADVLMAIQTIHKNNIGIFINQYAMFYEMIDEIQSETLDPFIVKYKNIGWNLSKDNILDQSDDFCEFIYNLIK